MSLLSEKVWAHGSVLKAKMVIEALERCGGININNLSGGCPAGLDCIYYIDDDDEIQVTGLNSFIGRLIVTHQDWREVQP